MLFNRGRANVTNPAVLEQGCRISTFCKVDLEQVEVYKYLGIWLDSALTFKPHIVKLRSKVRARLYRNKLCFTRPAKYLLVQMSVLPILDYGDVIYKAASNAALRKLDALYHSAIRFVTGVPTALITVISTLWLAGRHFKHVGYVIGTDSFIKP